MRALVVTLFAIETNTSVSISNYGIVKGLIELGYEVTLLMPTLNKKLPYFDDAYELKNVKIIRIKNENLASKIVEASINFSETKKKVVCFIKKLYNKFQIFDKTKMLIKEADNIKIEEYYDIIISTSDPKTSHKFLKRLIDNGLSYGRWIQHWGDPLLGDISKKYIYPKFIIKMYEKSILKNADKIVYVSPLTLEEQKKKYKKLAKKMEFVPLPCIYEKSEENIVKEKGKMKIVYLGDYSSSIRDINPLYNSCKKLKFVDLTIAGNSNLKLENYNNVHILPRISQKEVKDLENRADIIIAIGNKSGTQIPGKIYYTAYSQKPIVFIADGKNKNEIIEYLNKFNRFICCLNNEKSIMDCIKNLEKNYVTYNHIPEDLRPKNVAKNIVK